MKIEELIEIFGENGLYAVRVENGDIVSTCQVRLLRGRKEHNGPALIYFVNGRVKGGFMLREDEFVTSLRALKELCIKAGFSAFEDK